MKFSITKSKFNYRSVRGRHSSLLLPINLSIQMMSLSPQTSASNSLRTRRRLMFYRIVQILGAYYCNDSKLYT